MSVKISRTPVVTETNITLSVKPEFQRGKFHLKDNLLGTRYRYVALGMSNEIIPVDI